MTLLTVTTESATEPLRLQARDNYRLYGTRLCRTDLCRSAACGVSGRLDWVAVALSLVVEQWSRELGFFRQ